MNFSIQPAAEADIAAHIDYLLEEYAYDAAERFPVAFGEAIEFSRANPAACPQFAAFRSWPLPGFPKVRVFFAIQVEEIVVARVLHTARDVDSILDNE